MRGKAVAAGAVATLAMVAGVTYWAVSGDDEPFTVSGYKAMCQKPREYAETAPHAGSGPRPVYIDGFWPLTDTDAKELNASSEAATTTHSWAPPARAPSPCTSIHTGSSPTTAPATSPAAEPVAARRKWRVTRSIATKSTDPNPRRAKLPPLGFSFINSRRKNAI